MVSWSFTSLLTPDSVAGPTAVVTLGAESDGGRCAEQQLPKVRGDAGALFESW